MSEFFRSIPSHFKNAFVALFRNLAMSLSAIFSVTITLLLLGVFLILIANVDLFADNIEDSLVIHVVLQPEIKEEAQIEQVKGILEGISGVDSIRFSSKDDELKLMIKERGEELKIYEGKNNPLSHAFFVSLEDSEKLEDVTNRIRQLEQVKDAQYGGKSSTSLVTILDYVRYGGLVFLVLLGLLSLFLIHNAIKMTIHARSEEIKVMRQVGASNWYVKMPFMIEGIIIGMLGAFIPCLVAYIGYNWILEISNGYIITSLFTLIPKMPFILYLMGALVLIGMIVGLFGSLISTSKYLRFSR